MTNEMSADDNGASSDGTVLTVMRLLEIFKNFSSVKCLSASVGNSRRKLAERSSCSRLNAPETVS